MTEHQREVVWEYVGYVDSCIKDNTMPPAFEKWYVKWYGLHSESENEV